MRDCPFCGADESELTVDLVRVVCGDCGASGPVSGDPEAAWEVRTEDDFDYSIQSMFRLVYADDETPAIELDGSVESVTRALDRVFLRSRKKKS